MSVFKIYTFWLVIFS